LSEPKSIEDLVSLAHKLQSDYEELRAEWAESIGRPYPKRRKKIKPPPGSIELQDDELG